jgi:hypothetical protein
MHARTCIGRRIEVTTCECSIALAGLPDLSEWHRNQFHRLADPVARMSHAFGTMRSWSSRLQSRMRTLGTLLDASRWKS